MCIYINYTCEKKGLHLHFGSFTLIKETLIMAIFSSLPMFDLTDPPYLHSYLLCCFSPRWWCNIGTFFLGHGLQKQLHASEVADWPMAFLLLPRQPLAREGATDFSCGPLFCVFQSRATCGCQVKDQVNDCKALNHVALIIGNIY